MEFLKKIIRKHLLSRKLYTNFVDTVSRRILLSKRMLVDHIEILEQCQVIPSKAVEHHKNEIYRTFFFEGLTLFSVAVVSVIMDRSGFRFLFSIATTTFGCWFAIYIIYTAKMKLSQYRLNETIKVINKTDIGIRRNIIFFRESETLNNIMLESQKYLKSITEIIRILYAEVQILESIPLPDSIEIMYDPIEELSTSINFQNDTKEVTIDHLKAFYNIFLYFQSQYFLRIYLIINFNTENGLKYLNNESICFRKNMKALTEKLVSWMNTSTYQICNNVHRKLDDFRLEVSNPQNQDSLKMKSFSSDLLCRLTAIIQKYQSIDEWVHSHDMHTHIKKDEMLKISMELNLVKDSMNACQEDIEALNLIHNKCFTQMFQIPNESNYDMSEKDAENSSNILKQFDDSQKCDIEEESREYFGMNICEETENKNTEEKYLACSLQDELLNTDLKVTRLCFAPVLKQLKSKLSPIKTEMKERELKYLMSKGLDRDTIIKFDENDDIQALKPDFGHTQTKSETKSPKDRYYETRSFLQQKQQFMCMPLPLPLQLREEDILE